MKLSIPETYEILIVGAGPVGLFLACELRLAGCSVLVLEQTPNPHIPLKRAPFGLRGLSVATIEALDRRDLLSALEARTNMDEIAAAARWMHQERRPAGHFAGIDFFHDQIDQERWSYRLPGTSGPIAADLASIEAVLTERAQALGVMIRRGFGVTDIAVTSEVVTVRAGEQVAVGRWLVGCDGARSAVRKAAGFGFAGTEPEFTGYFVQAELADPQGLPSGHHDTHAGTYIYEAGMIRMIEFDDGRFHRAGPMTREHVEAVLHRISGIDVEVATLGLATTWTDRAYLATEYRKGRVLLAGDAAHIHSPLGGQGLNLGLGDAMNLGWKLAATIQGDATPDLLDSYERERRPVAEQVLDWSRAQVAVMRPSRSSQALRSIIGDLMATREGATYFAERVWGVGLRYDLGSDHPLVGRSAPNLELSDGTRVNEQLRTGRALLIDWEGSDPLRQLARPYGNQVSYAAGHASGGLGLRALLVRPDGFVAWASDLSSDAATAARFLARWFAAGEQ